MMNDNDDDRYIEGPPSLGEAIFLLLCLAYVILPKVAMIKEWLG